jgi:hypothetical protein
MPDFKKLFVSIGLKKLFIIFLKVCLPKGIFIIFFFAIYISTLLFRSQLALAHSCSRFVIVFFRSVESRTVCHFVFLFLSFCASSRCGGATSAGAEDCTGEGYAPGSGPGPRCRAPGGSGHAQEPPGLLITCPSLPRVCTHRFVFLIDQISIKTPIPKFRLYWYLI